MNSHYQRYVKRMSKPIAPDASLGDFLARHTKEELLDIKRLWGVSISPALRKQEIVDRLAEAIPLAIPGWCRKIPQTTYELLTGKLSPLDDTPMLPIALNDLVLRGLGHFVMAEDRIDFLVPREAKAAVPKNRAIKKAIGQNELKIIFIQGLLNLYGLIPMEVLTNILNTYLLDPVSERDLSEWLETETFMYFKGHLGFVGGEFLFIHDLAKNPREILHSRPDLDYAEFTPDDLASLWSNRTTVKAWPYFQAMLDALFEHEVIEGSPLEKAITDMQFSFLNDEKSMACIQPVLDCIITEDLEDLKGLLQKIMDYQNHSHKWTLNGNAPADLSAGEAPPQAEPFKSSKKVGRNDPCPCGSGKKYKKCCLPKDEKDNITRIH